MEGRKGKKKRDGGAEEGVGKEPLWTVEHISSGL